MPYNTAMAALSASDMAQQAERAGLAQEAPVSAVLSRQEKAATHLRMMLDNLEARLQPVMLPGAPPGSAAVNKGNYILDGTKNREDDLGHTGEGTRSRGGRRCSNSSTT